MATAMRKAPKRAFRARELVDEAREAPKGEVRRAGRQIRAAAG